MTARVQVGDEVRVYGDGLPFDGVVGTVTKVGRVYVYICWPSSPIPEEFLLAGGQRKGSPHWPSRYWFRTLAEVADDHRRADAVATLAGCGLRASDSDRGHSRYTTEALEELAGHAARLITGLTAAQVWLLEAAADGRAERDESTGGRGRTVVTEAADGWVAHRKTVTALVAHGLIALGPRQRERLCTPWVITDAGRAVLAALPRASGGSTRHTADADDA